jgi:hypothetical protein
MRMLAQFFPTGPFERPHVMLMFAIYLIGAFHMS